MTTRKSTKNAEKNSEASATASGETLKNERDVILTGVKTALDRLQQPRNAPDDVQVFGNFLVAELRKIKSKTYRKSTQRKLLQFLWECMEKEPVKPHYFTCVQYFSIILYIILITFQFQIAITEEFVVLAVGNELQLTPADKTDNLDVMHEEHQTNASFSEFLCCID